MRYELIVVLTLFVLTPSAFAFTDTMDVQDYTFANCLTLPQGTNPIVSGRIDGVLNLTSTIGCSCALKDLALSSKKCLVTFTYHGQDPAFCFVSSNWTCDNNQAISLQASEQWNIYSNYIDVNSLTPKIYLYSHLPYSSKVASAEYDNLNIECSDANLSALGYQIILDNSAQCVDTGLYVEADSLISINSSGLIDYWGNTPTYGPEGRIFYDNSSEPFNPLSPCPTLYAGAVVGKINGQCFYIGKGYTGTAGYQGNLQICTNDHIVSDNSGKFIEYIHPIQFVSHTQAQTTQDVSNADSNCSSNINCGMKFCHYNRCVECIADEHCGINQIISENTYCEDNNVKRNVTTKAPYCNSVVNQCYYPFIIKEELQQNCTSSNETCQNGKCILMQLNNSVSVQNNSSTEITATTIAQTKSETTSKTATANVNTAEQTKSNQVLPESKTQEVITKPRSNKLSVYTLLLIIGAIIFSISFYIFDGQNKDLTRCSKCSKKIKVNGKFCKHCGQSNKRGKIHNKMLKQHDTAVVLSICGGWAGIDRLYLGQIGWGLLKLVTLGGLFIWWLLDIILIATKDPILKVEWRDEDEEQ